jgi:glutathione S-transferase
LDKAAALDNLNKGLYYIDHYIDAAAWAVGGKPSIADCALIPILTVVSLLGKFYEIPDLISKYKKHRIYWEMTNEDEIHALMIAEQFAKAAKLNPVIE